MEHKSDAIDLTTAKLPALQFYQLAIPVSKPPDGAFDKAAAGRGDALFNGKAKCAGCRGPPIYSEPGWNLHAASEIGIDDFQANRGANKIYRTTPLHALWDMTKTHKGGFYHDGRFVTLQDVVTNYNTFMKLGLTDPEMKDLIEFLRSL